jgi:hypothetical protein
LVAVAVLSGCSPEREPGPTAGWVNFGDRECLMTAYERDVYGPGLGQVGTDVDTYVDCRPLYSDEPIPGEDWRDDLTDLP